MKARTSDIPADAIENTIREYSDDGALIFFRVTECMLDGQVVGQRAYDANGDLRHETPLRNGQKHGREYIWNEIGALESMEPYVNGKLHGLSEQYGRNGKVIGTYRFVRGTGYDIWRQEREDGSVFISEIHTIQDGSPHGFEWWLNANQSSVWHELHWRQGRYHGIERMWNEKGDLRRGYPKFWIQGQQASKREYLDAAKRDPSLPTWQELEDRPERQFPEEIELASS